jgi:lipopolysaccharide export LptBFGC system permease protein LptF
MELFDNEKLITNSKDNQIVLTSKRIRQTEKGKDITSIMLEKISSVEVKYQSFFLILLAGILVIIAGILMLVTKEDTAIFTIVGGAVLILFYFLTRKHTISISSDGGAKIVFVTQGMNNETVLEFVHQVELAKMEIN